MSQPCGRGLARDTNRLLKELMEFGQTGVFLSFDLPTLVGYDADDPVTLGEVGRTGVHVGSLRDMEELLEDIPLTGEGPFLNVAATAPMIYAFLLLVARGRGIADGELAGTVQNDILKEYVAGGNYIFPPGPSLRLATELIAFASETTPKFHPISISGYPIRDAGCGAIAEMAYALSFALATVEQTRKRGLDIDQILPRLSWFFSAHGDFFEEVAKFRALRRLWARIAEERLGAKDPRSLAMRIHVQTASSTMAGSQPLVNIPRAAFQALSAVLGGVHSLSLSPYAAGGEASLPARVMGLRTQQVLEHETGVSKITDPLRGSWYIEELTDQLEEGASSLLAAIFDDGGALAQIESGRMVSAIGDAAFAHQRELEENKRLVVGVNVHEKWAKSWKIAREDSGKKEDAGRVQQERLKELRRNRDNAACDASLARLGEAAKGGAPLMEAIIEAAGHYATNGEMVGILKAVFGSYGNSMTQL